MQRDWIEKDFYRELGVSSDAPADEIKKAYRKLARELHPDANPGDAKAEARFKSVSEAYGVLVGPAKRKEYDETRRLFGRRRRLRRRLRRLRRRRRVRRQRPVRPGARGTAAVAAASATCSAACSTGAAARLPRRPRGRAAAPTSRPRSASTSSRRSRARRCRCACPRPAACDDVRRHGREAGHRRRAPARPATGAGLVSRSQGAFAFSEPCRDCRGTGRIIDDPCPECGGDGVSTRTRTLTVRIPAGVDDGQQIRLAGPGRAGPRRRSDRRPVRRGARHPAPRVRPHGQRPDAHRAGDVPRAALWAPR